MAKWYILLFSLALFSTCAAQDPDKKTEEAIALAQKGKLDESFRLFLEVKEEFKKMGDVNGTASTLNNIGRIYYMMNNIPEARKNLLESYSLYKSLNDKSSQAELLMNIGATYEADDGKTLDKALQYYQRANVICRSLRDSMGIHRSLLNMGSVYGRKGESRKALDVYLETLSYLERNGTNVDKTAAYVNIGTSFYELHKPDSALPYLYKAMSLNDTPEHDIYINRTLAKVYADLNEPDSVAYYIDLFSAAKDQLQNEQTTRTIAEISQKYEAQVNKEEIKNLKLGKKRDRLWSIIIVLILVGIVIILILLFRNRMIKTDHQKKDLEHRILRAQMNPHFLFNCLSSIQRMYIEGDIQEANDLTADFGTLLRQILDHTSRSRIRLKEELEALQSYMQIEQVRLAQKFRFEITADENVNVDKILVPPLISQPIIENAIWHGIVPLQEDGQITVQCHLSQDKKTLILDVYDNGVGFSEAKKFRTHVSKGIELVKNRLTSKGSLKIQAGKQGGTWVTIRLPVEYDK